MKPVRNSLIKEWRSKLTFLYEELRYMYIKLQRVDKEISAPEKDDQFHLFREQVLNDLKEIKWKTVKLESDNLSDLNQINFESSLHRYEEVKQRFEVLMNDDTLFEVA